MAQGYTIQAEGMFSQNDSVRYTGVTGLTLTGNTLAVTANAAPSGSGNQSIDLTKFHSVRLFAGVAEFPVTGNTHTISGTGANVIHV